MERKTREHTFQIQGWKDRIVFLGIIALLGGSDVIKVFVPGMGSDPETITRIDGEIKALNTKIETVHDDMHHEVNILDAKIDDTMSTCMSYRIEDAEQMESLRHKTKELDLLIKQCLDRTK